MAIIISKEGKDAKKVERQPFEQEAELQQYICENPEALPLDEVKEGIRLLVLAREFPTNSGPIDALGVDADGDVYIIETKLYRNPDKRLVVAQVLDYGASMWKTYSDLSEFQQRLEQEVAKEGKGSLAERLQEFFALEEDGEAELIANMQANVQSGNFRFVVLMDSMAQRLKDLILFVNQNSRFDIYGVELDYYKFDQYEIMIPSLFGAEVKKTVSGGSPSGRQSWDKDKFVAELRGLEDRKLAGRLESLLKLVDENPSLFRLAFGKGKRGAALGKDHTNTTIFMAAMDGRLYIASPEESVAGYSDVQNFMAEYDSKLNWTEPFHADMRNWPRLTEHIEELSDLAFEVLVQSLTDFGKLRAVK